MSSFDQVIRNILAGIFAEEQQEETVRPRARPSGLGAPTTSVRPRARPEDVEPAKPTATETTTNFINEMASYDDSPDEGIEIPLSDLKTDARSLDGKFKTTATDLARLNRNSRGSKVRVKSVVQDDELDSIMSDIKTVLSTSPATRKPMQFADLETQQLLYDVETSILSPRTQTRNPVLDASAAPEFTPRDFELTTKDVQSMLSTKGYDVGKLDGVMGPRTEAAIKQFQKDRGLKVDGKVGPKTRAAMEASAYSVPMDVKFSSDVSDMSDALTVSGNIKKSKEEKLDVQKALLELGYDVGAVDGIIGTKTRAAIRQFQKDQDLKADAIVGENTAAAMNAALSGRQSVDMEDQEIKVIKSSIIPMLPESVQDEAAFATDVFKAVLSPVGRNFMNDIMFGGKLQYFNPIAQLPFGDRLVSRQNKAGAEVFSQPALDLMKKIVMDEGILEKGSVTISKDIYKQGGISVNQRGGSGAKEIINALASGDQPINELKLMLGQFNAKIDENNDIIVTDRFNYNAFINPIDGKQYTPDQYDKAIEAGKFTETEVLKAIFSGDLNYEMVRAAGFVLGSRDYKGDNPKDQGRVFEINLGPVS